MPLNFEEWVSLPKRDRENRFGWYIMPEIAWEDYILSDKKNPYDEYLKKTYPVQWFLRDTLYYFLLEWLVWNPKKAISFVEDWVSPKQKWLTRQIPNSWCDKTALIPDIMFACVIHFVEEENSGFPQSKNKDWGIDWSDREEIYKTILDCYRYAKMRARLEEKTWNTKYPISCFMESLYDKCERHYMNKIVEVHQYLFT